MNTTKNSSNGLTAAQQALSELWDEHVGAEFATKDAPAALDTMTPDAYVNHVPVLTGGNGKEQLRDFYANHFIPKMPADTEIVPISRTIGEERLVDEMIFRFTHNIEIDWMLPEIAPTGKRVECATVVVVTFRDGKLFNEHIYWDQASVLVQLGLLDPVTLPVAGVETARKVIDPTLPSNQLMQRAATGARAAKMMKFSSVPFKRSPPDETTLDVYGVDVTFLVEGEHTGGAFGMLEYVSKPGHEPPPHCHEYEDEVFYIAEGHLEMHCGDQVFQVEAGECVFLPKRKPHGFIVRSPRMRAICIVQPSGAEEGLRILGVPKNGGQRQPTGSTYASAMLDPANPMKVAAQLGVHILSRDEIAVSMPHFPLPVLR